MKSISIIRPAAWAGLVTLVLGMHTAFAEPLVYVPLGGAGRILVIDAATDEIVDTISGVAAVHGLAKTPDGQFLIAGSYEERAAGSEAVAKPAGVSEDEHAAHHGTKPEDSKRDGAVVSTLSVVRTADGSIVRRIDVPGAVHHVAVSPDGRFAVVTHPYEDTISAIDLASYEVVATVATGSLPNYVVFSPDSKRVYVTNAGGNTVSEVDTGQWIVSRNMATGSSPEHMAPSPDGGLLYVANVDDGAVSEIETENGATLRSFAVGGPLHGLDLSRDGGTLFISALNDDKLIAIDLATAKIRSLLLAPSPYHLASIGATGKLYVSSAEQPNIWVVDEKDLVVLGKIVIGGKGHQMALSPGS